MASTTTIIKKIDTSQISKLSDENYGTWKLQVSVVLKAQQLWTIVDGTEVKPTSNPEKWMEKDTQAMAIIVTLLDAKQLNHVAELESSKQMWDKLRNINSDASQFNKQLTQSKFFNYKIKKGQSITDAFSEIEALTRNLKEIGIAMAESTVVAKIVSALPDGEYGAFRSAWDSVPDADQTMDRLLGRLKKEEQVSKVKVESESSGFRESKDETNVAFKSHQHQKSQKQWKGKKNGKNRPKCFNCGKLGHVKRDCWDDEGAGGDQQVRSGASAGTKCYGCGKNGHFKRDCPDQEGGGGQQRRGQGSSHRNNGNRQQGRRDGEEPFTAFMTRGAGHSDGSTEFQKEEVWWSDSGANKHYTGTFHWFLDYEPYNAPRPVTLTNNQSVEALGEGTVLLEALINEQWTQARLENVVYIPGGFNIFSECVMAQKGYVIITDRERTRFILRGRHGPEADYSKSGYMMKFRRIGVSERAFHTKIPINEAKLWHERLGHINVKFLRETVKKGAVRGIPTESLTHEVKCNDCHLGKQTRNPFPSAERRNFLPGESIHADLSGHIPIKSRRGFEYFLICVDEASSFRHVSFMKKKSETNERMRDFIALIETQTKNKVKRVRTDNGTELKNEEMTEFYQSKGIIHDWTTPHTPETNGRAERNIRTLKEAARTMLNASKVPKSFWVEALESAVYVLNRTLNSVATETTAFEQVFGETPYLGHAHVFGCTAFVQIPKANRKGVWEAKSKKMQFVGYDSVDFAYKLYDPDTQTIVRSKSVKFDEEAEEAKKISIITEEDEDELQFEEEEIPMENGKAEENEATNHHPLHSPPTTSSVEDANKPRVLRDRSQLKEPDRLCCKYTLQAPSNYEEAVAGEDKEKWMNAMQEEYDSLMKHGTWELVKAPMDAKILESKWVYKVKENGAGEPARAKARLVVKGFMQEEGVDFHETFAGVTRYESVRLLLQIASARNMYIQQFDVKTAFLNGKLEETIFMTQPQGFEKRGGRKLYCLLRKSLYGLKQAPRCWRRALSAAMHKLGLAEIYSDSCVYHNLANTVFWAMWVDDGLVTGERKEEVDQLLLRMSKMFETTISGLGTFIGMQLIKMEAGIIISQQRYIERLLEKFGLKECKPCQIPMEPNLHLVKAESATEVMTKIPYRELIGSLLFIARVSRPDIMFAVNNMSQFNSGYDEEHFRHAKQILRYLKGTKNLGLVLKGGLTLQGFTDADYAGDRNDRKSTSGFTFFLGEGLISWTSEKQPVVTVSSTEAEYVALSTGAKEGIWLQRFLIELGFSGEEVCPTQILVDNTSTINLAENPIVHKRSKHIDVRFHHTRELIEKREIEITHVPTEDQKADILTKPLPVTEFKRKRAMLGLVMISLLCLTGTQAFNFQTTSSVIWREAGNPIANGFDRVHMKIKLISPCKMTTTGLLQPDLVKPALEMCNKLYKEMITEKMDGFCPETVQHTTVNSEEHGNMVKRAVPIVAVGAIVLSVVAVVGIGVTSIVGVVKATNNEEKIEVVTQNLVLAEGKVNDLIDKHNDLVDLVEKLSSKMDSHVNTTVSTTYSLSYITVQLVNGKALTLEGSKDWKNGRVNEKLLEFWNVSLPCKMNCPVSLGTPVSCHYMKETEYWYLTFDVPIINRKQSLLVADHFTLMIREQGRTCSVNYIGTKMAVKEIRKGTTCLQALQGLVPEKGDVMVHLGDACAAGSRNMTQVNRTAYTITWCQETEENDHLSFIQMKHIKGFTVIYCPLSLIEIRGEEHQCPDQPFLVPTTTSFKVNGVPYIGTSTHLVVKGSPAMVMEANWILTPKVNFTALKETSLHFREVPVNWTIQLPWMVGVGMMGLAFMGLGIGYLKLRQSPRVILRAKKRTGGANKKGDTKEAHEFIVEESGL